MALDTFTVSCAALTPGTPFRVSAAPTEGIRLLVRSTGTVGDLWKAAEIPIGTLGPLSIATEAIPT